MGRLWIRLSLVFILVIGIVVLALGIVVRINMAPIPRTESVPSPELLDNGQIRQGPAPPFDPTTFGLIIGATAIIAGILMSRYLTRPLSDLMKGAEAIRQQDFAYRVPVEGSEEMVAVAGAFNDMAAQLEQQENLRRNLLADVTHELRHPVHIMRGNLQAILDDVYPLEKEEIGRLLDQTQHLAILVNDLHIIAQAEARQLPLQKQETDIAALLKQAAASYDAQARANDVDLRVELLGTMPESILVDKARIRQAIHNLLDNSIRHVRPGCHILLSSQKENGRILIKVSDDGEGIAAENLPYVFDRFYQADKARSRSKESTGLGLAIVKAIVEAHHGGVQVNSAGVNQGSEFTIELPLT